MRLAALTLRQAKPLRGRYTIVRSSSGPVAVLLCGQLGQVRSGLQGGRFELTECVQGDCLNKFCWADLDLRRKLRPHVSQVVVVCLECAIQAGTIPRSFLTIEPHR